MTTSVDQAEIAVIGGGVVGCAIFRRLAMLGLRPLLVEAGGDILSGASKGNSALLHTGFDAPFGSLELACMQAGYNEYLEIKDKLNLPLVESTALVVAWDEEQLSLFDNPDHIRRQKRLIAAQRDEAVRMRIFLERSRVRLPRPLIPL